MAAVMCVERADQAIQQWLEQRSHSLRCGPGQNDVRGERAALCVGPGVAVDRSGKGGGLSEGCPPMSSGHGHACPYVGDHLSDQWPCTGVRKRLHGAVANLMALA